MHTVMNGPDFIVDIDGLRTPNDAEPARDTAVAGGDVALLQRLQPHLSEPRGHGIRGTKPPAPGHRRPTP